MPALMAIKVLIARVNGGNESVIDLAMLCYLSGSGITIRLLWPFASTDRTPKITLSLESRRSTFGSEVRSKFYSAKSASVVLRQSTSYAVAPGAGFHSILESFSNRLVNKWTSAGGAGDEASDANVAAFRRVTFAT